MSFFPNVIPITGGTTSRSLSDHFSDILCVKDFGAIGNNVADDYIGIQTALNAAFNAGGKTVYMPATGSAYYISKGLLVPPGVCLMGAGGKTFYANNGSVAQWCKTGTWLRCTDTTNTACQLGNPIYTNPPDNTFWNSGISNCTISGDGTTATISFPGGTSSYTAAAGKIGRAHV